MVTQYSLTHLLSADNTNLITIQTQLLLLQDDLRLSGHLCRSVRETLHHSIEMRALLKQVIADIEVHPVDRKTKAEKKRGLGYSGNTVAPRDERSQESDLQDTAPDGSFDRLSHLLGLHDDAPTIIPEDNVASEVAGAPLVPVVHGVVRREVLGQMLRRAGEDYAFVLYLAAAQLVRERVLRAIETAKGGGLSEEDKNRVLDTITEDFKTFSRIRADPTDEASIPQFTTPFSIADCSNIVLRNAVIYKEELMKVMQATEFVFEAARRFQLAGVWRAEPIIKGNTILKMFPKLPQGPIISEVRFTCAWAAFELVLAACPSVV